MTKKIILAAIAASVLASFSPIGAAFAEETTTQAQAETVLHEGVWTKKSFKSAGEWSIIEAANGVRYIKLSDDFRTRNAPDLKIFLSPQAAADATGSNATDGALLISPLESNRGAQTYEIPADVDLDAYASILIHCEAYSKLWSASDLS